MNATNPPPLQWWGGVECTINRVGDRFFSQLARNGHRSRLSDLDQFAALGLKRLRFPILWEELAADSPGSIHWELVEPHLQRMRELGLQPIAGLLHHGSGPRYTHLLDPDFPRKLATFAQAVAERFPWIDAFTPVNEPLTTARFSALYGHWFPHARDGLSFARAFLNQLCATVLAMRAIREVNPRAALVQTEDLGKTFSSPRLQYQAEFENERRWLTWDLLCGRVHHEHPMWHYLRWLGAEEREISFFAEEPCPPQVIGVNHYITSERFLDEHLHPYPRETYGGNGRDRYADVAAVRARAEGIAGPETLLRETCARYAIPVAVTEAHLGCTRDEQMRWLHEIWRAAESLRGARHNVCAVTAWSLLGAFDWDSLLTRADNHYEPGVFDVRSSPPRPTAIAWMLGSLANGKNFSHPVLSSPGWWRRSIRLESSGECPTRSGFMAGDEAPCEGSPLLITGAAGRLGRAFQWAANLRALAYCAFTRQELDLTSSDAIARVLDQVKPWSVINCAGFSSVDAAEREASACILVNTTAAELLARACAERDIPLLTFSSDYVFD
ncbi:MAG TPA: sugar nucleotide-binding protein, partial [Chthoniobacterales bacterium]|nr:sugar nucleotide-binding protein [Chthoniobacterales bacterium]